MKIEKNVEKNIWGERKWNERNVKMCAYVVTELVFCVEIKGSI